MVIITRRYLKKNMEILEVNINCWHCKKFTENENSKVTSAAKWSLLKICHLRQRLRIFLFCRKIMFHSQDVQVFAFLAIPLFTESVTSLWVLVHETRYIILNISFEPQLIKSPNLANKIIFSNLLNNLEDWD